MFFNKNTCESPILREKKTISFLASQLCFQDIEVIGFGTKRCQSLNWKKVLGTTVAEKHVVFAYHKRRLSCKYHSYFWKVDVQAKWWSHKSQWMGGFPCFLSESSNLRLYTSICCFLSSGLEIHLASKSFRDFYEYEINPYKSSSSLAP